MLDTACGALRTGTSCHHAYSSSLPLAAATRVAIRSPVQTLAAVLVPVPAQAAVLVPVPTLAAVLVPMPAQAAVLEGPSCR
jgi:hypothetical protein